MRGPRREAGRDGRTSLKRSTRRGRRVTLTAAPDPRLRGGNRQGPCAVAEGPRDITGNVQLYLPEWSPKVIRGPVRMGAPLTGRLGWVKVVKHVCCALKADLQGTARPSRERSFRFSPDCSPIYVGKSPSV